MPDSGRSIIWEGQSTKGNERFRIVGCPDHEPPKPTHILEMRHGHDALGVDRWGHVASGSFAAAMFALMDYVVAHSSLLVAFDVRMERGSHARWQAELYEATLAGQDEERANA